MENIRIYSPNGVGVLDVPVTSKATHSQELMKTDQIHLEWSAAECVRLPLGAYVIVNGISYILPKPYYPDSKALGKYDYSIDFVHEIILLKNIPFLLHSATGTECDWNYTGLFADLKNALKTAITTALGRQYDIVIDDDITGAVSLSFSNVDIFSALNSVADALGCEWWYDELINGSGTYTIYFGVKCVHEGGAAQTLELTAGQEVGYPTSSNKAEYYNRYYVFGSTRNIPQDYQGAQANTIVNKRLTLDPSIHPNGYLDLPKYDINGNIYETTSDNPNGRAYWKADGTLGYYVVDDSVAAGVRTFTKVLTLDDIYPRAGLKVAHIAKRSRFVRDENDDKVEIGAGVYSTYSVFYIQLVDAAGDVFCINPTTYQPTTNPDGHILPNTTPGIHFNTGALTGREFDMYRYYDEVPTLKNETDGSAVDFSAFEEGDNAGIFELAVKEDNTIVIPNDGIEPVINDEAVVFNVRMPNAYVVKGYKDLDQEALIQMYEDSKDGNEYSVEGNDVYFAGHEHNITLGRHLYFNTQGRRMETRVIKMTKNLDRSFDIELTFGKAIRKGTIQSLLTSIESTQQQVVTTQLESTQSLKEQQKRAYDAQRELHDMIFDTDDYFKDGNIRPSTIETLMLQVGGKSTNFILSGWVMTPNINGTQKDADHVSWTSGKLTHYGLSADIREWNIVSDVIDLESSDAHYIYAKCVSTAGATRADIIITTEQIQFDARLETENCYYFLIGTLSSVSAGIRVANLTYGMSAINGQFITTGVIRSNTGNFYVNLNTGELYSENGFKFKSGGQTKTFTSYATETTTAINNASSKIDNMVISGVNMLPHSKLDTLDYLYNYISGYKYNAVVVDDDIFGKAIQFGETNGASIGTFRLKANTEYTFSWYAKCDARRSNDNKCAMLRELFGSIDLSKDYLCDLGAKVGRKGITIVAHDSNPRDSSIIGFVMPTDMEWHRYWTVFKINEAVAAETLSIRLGIMAHTPDQGSKARFANIQLEEGNKATEWREAQADIDERTQSQIDALNAGIQQQLNDLEAQIDNEIEYYFEEYAPSLSNAPANTWTTEQAKKEHIGDVFYYTTEGTTYKWVHKDNVYQWMLIENDPSAIALATAQQALAEVGDKNAIIYGHEPVPPYQKGDMYSRGGSQPLLICIQSRDTGAYNASDWDDATSYIDDIARSTASSAQTTADNAVAAAANAASLAAAAQSAAASTQAALDKIDDDEYFSVVEKRTMQPQWRAISGRSDTTNAATAGGSCYDTKAAATAAGIASTDSKVTTLDTRYTELRQYLDAVGLYTDSAYKFTSTWTRAKLSDRFTKYHAAEMALADAVSAKLASTAEANAKSYADTKAGSALSAANAAQATADSYKYLQDALAEATKGGGNYEVEIQGGVILSNALEALDASGNVTAGVSGLRNNGGSSIALWAGGARTDGSIPFVVTQDGEVTMSKANITSGTQNGTQVAITTKNNGSVGAIMVGSTGGNDTEIVGEASGGVEGMLTAAGINASSAYSSISGYQISKNARLDSAYWERLAYSAATSSPTQSIDNDASPRVMIAAGTKGGVATLGNFAIAQSFVAPTLTCSGSCTAATSSYQLIAVITVDILVGDNVIDSAVKQLVYGNSTTPVVARDEISKFNGYKVVYGVNQAVKLRVRHEVTLSCQGSVQNNNTGSVKTNSGNFFSYNVTYDNSGKYISQVLNNVIYNDGIFMSRATDRYIAISPASEGRLMELVCGGHGAGFTKYHGLCTFTKTTAGIDKTSFDQVLGCLWAGSLTFSSSSVSVSSKWYGGLENGSLTATRSTSGQRLICLRYGVKLNSIPLVYARLLTSTVGWHAIVREVTNECCYIECSRNDNSNFTSGEVVVIIIQI